MQKKLNRDINLMQKKILSLQLYAKISLYFSKIMQKKYVINMYANGFQTFEVQTQNVHIFTNTITVTYTHTRMQYHA